MLACAWNASQALPREAGSAVPDSHCSLVTTRGTISADQAPQAPQAQPSWGSRYLAVCLSCTRHVTALLGWSCNMQVQIPPDQVATKHRNVFTGILQHNMPHPGLTVCCVDRNLPVLQASGS